jgi:hypothetical protein
MLHKLPDSTVQLIRQRKTEGKSLTEIATECNCTKSTVSLYCRNLFDNPRRKYKTEQEARQAILTLRRGKPRKRYPVDNHQIYLDSQLPCTKCGKPRQRHSKTGLCIICLRQQRRENANHPVQKRRQFNPSGYHEDKSAKWDETVKNQNAGFCPKSPIGKHSCTSGVCFWCYKFVN